MIEDVSLPISVAAILIAYWSFTNSELFWLVRVCEKTHVHSKAIAEHA